MGGVNPMEMQMQAQMMAMMQNGGMGFGGQGMMDPMAVMMQQQEQLAHMQIMMNQMAEAVNKGGPVHQAVSTDLCRVDSQARVLNRDLSQPVRPPKPTAQPAQKLGDHTIIARPGVKAPPAAAKAHEPVPTKPTSPDLCKFGVGCTNVRCPYSHPSPVATIASGVVLRTDPCPNGKACKDADCSYSHVSPAQVHGESAWCAAGGPGTDPGPYVTPQARRQARNGSFASSRCAPIRLASSGTRMPTATRSRHQHSRAA